MSNLEQQLFAYKFLADIVPHDYPFDSISESDFKQYSVESKKKWEALAYIYDLSKESGALSEQEK
jgi:hypothetical protein